MSIASHLTWFRSDDVRIVARAVAPTDVTGWAVTFQVRDSLGGTSRITKTTGGGGISLTDAGRGVLTIIIAKADTQGLAPGNYVWDLKRTDTGSNTVLAHGTLT